MARRLSAVDWAFLLAETPTNLAHVAGLWVFRLPEAHGQNFWRDYVNGLVEPKTATPPFNYKLSDGLQLPGWIEDPEFDLDNHVHYSALPQPGSTDQLLGLVSGLHSRALDRSRPLWECYLIEGLSEQRVAIYFKVHHALLDGGSAMEYMLRSFSRSSGDHARRPFWQPAGEEIRPLPSIGLLGRLGRITAEIVSQAKTLPELSRIVAGDGLEVLNLSASPAEAPFSAPKSPLGKSITSKRRFAVEGFSFSRIRALGKATGSTVNDIVLSMSAGALRDYLKEAGELPKEALTAWVPVSIRTGDEGEAGNRVAVIVCSLATELPDAIERLTAIKASVGVGKEQLQGMSAQTSDNYAALLGGLLLLTQKLGIAERLAPVANVVISNVSGSRDPLYVNGAKLVEQYPMSMLIDGQALNITVTSHDERLDFGLLACPRAVPDLQRLADRLEETLSEMEEAVAKDGRGRGDTMNEEPNQNAATTTQESRGNPEQTTGPLKAASDGTDGDVREGLNGPDPKLMRAQAPLWNAIMDRYFRLEIDGWSRIPDTPCLLIGVHSGGPLTMDAWTVVLGWWRHFEEERSIHGTAHDVLMAAPGLGGYFRRMGTISPSRENIAAAFTKGDDVILWPGGEVDSYRAWTKRDKAILGGRTGFIRLAIREQVPIVPVATVGGHDTLFVLSEGRGLAKALRFKKLLRSNVAPITLSVPFGVTLHITPFQHVPLPSKIRTEFLDPIYLDADRERQNDNEYVNGIYQQIESTIQSGMDGLAKKRKFPVFG